MRVFGVVRGNSAPVARVNRPYSRAVLPGPIAPHRPTTDTGGQVAILRIDAVLTETGDRSKTSIYNRIKDGLFPKAVPIGQRVVGWPDNEVKTIVAAQIAGQTPEQIRGLVGSLHAQRAERFKALAQAAA